MRVALVVGHKEASQGAVNIVSEMTEFRFNDDLVNRIIIEGLASGSKHDLLKVLRDTYRELPEKINRIRPDFAISFHANAFNSRVSGTEVLFYHRSVMGPKMALILQKYMCELLHLPDRKIKAVTVEGRGGYLLCHVKCPIVIVEPFFIDNDEDLTIATEKKGEMAKMFVSAIEEISQLI